MPPRKNGMTKDQQNFIDWLIQPLPRTPKTQEEYANENHVSSRTLRNWKKDTKFREAWDAALYDLNVSPDRIQAVIDAMWAGACRQNVKAAELYLKYVDRYRDVREVITTTASVEELSDEELEAEYQGFLANEVEKRQQAEAVIRFGDDDDDE